MPPVRDQRQDKVFIGGRWTESDGGALVDVLFPGDGTPIGQARLGSTADIDRAVKAAAASFASGVWRDTPPAQRRAVLDRAADILEAKIELLADVMTSELGCPHWFATGYHIPSPLRNLRYYAELAETYRYEEVRSDGKNRSLVIQEPVGVVAGITPWNAPLGTPILKAAPALAAGCSVVLKPAPETPFLAGHLADALAEAGLPEGVLSVVPGDREVGAHLVAHPLVDKVGFTGSTAAGRAIMAACAQRIARPTLELGGKSAAVVLDDADTEQFLRGYVPAATMLSGQACIAPTRVLVSRRRADEIIDALTEAFAALRVGDPFDPETQVGPLISERQRDRVLGYYRKGVEEGAKAATGGGVPQGDQYARGWYVEPTVFVDVTSDMAIAQEEIFGPAIVVLVYEDEDDAVRIANDSIYGLSGSVWSADQEHALALARRIRTGMVSINGFGQAKGSPFGGFKQSGIGREMGPEGMTAYLETKSVGIGPDA
ncbi:betaine-aldehyde dehydrogenase [Pseudonocardia thermophila]|uniref:Betaine-aldehyde dehydrogenase n=1 Tax=Pseudonocardia thermophila TaxID=1848 RepID=A0A1M6WR81_PSETH|nr:aldehyde dehydrogenase [Pseudonocardia thermophila]SHK96270.1 betaine-aldehyde dehydrogenase [Pseudonocardia thermophila]